MKYPKAIEQLIESLRAYPGVGKKTAERYALHTVNRLDEEQIDQIIEAYHHIKTDIFQCPVCGNITDTDPCYVCKDESRTHETMIVVEEAKDIIAMEKTNRYHGLYHVLNGVISPSNGIGPDDINLKSLLQRLQNDTIKEVILATNLNNEGETTANYIRRLLEGTDILVTRIAHGIPAGGNIEYADEITIVKALEGRRKL
ncbi:recombination mediator RecR [Candidatus Xianfuyuplasma coldseepsis]|uniref:Recombination protein RecR n=1 Tax=Candidatus Xianfuyuplasma coldseepsis TaxID=2782163 RepID=A0A7L7KSQ9_9MOLU|nr:recombination mediator RecR [Xianfuyuplasma coldseepsis]QMS84974.1 recombination protein RecR [Xianfuyuplasma coldseepsis]